MTIQCNKLHTDFESLVQIINHCDSVYGIAHSKMSTVITF